MWLATIAARRHKFVIMLKQHILNTFLQEFEQDNAERESFMESYMEELQQKSQIQKEKALEVRRAFTAIQTLQPNAADDGLLESDALAETQQNDTQ